MLRSMACAPATLTPALCIIKCLIVQLAQAADEFVAMASLLG